MHGVGNPVTAELHNFHFGRERLIAINGYGPNYEQWRTSHGGEL